MSGALGKLAKASKLAVHRVFYRAALCDQGTAVALQNKAAYEDVLARRMKEVGFNFKGIALLESGDIDWSVCGAYRLMPKRPSGHTGVWQYETLQFHGGAAEVSMRAMGLTDEGACILEPWSIKRAALVLHKGTDMETKKKCADIFKKDGAVNKMLEFALKKTGCGEAPDKEESDDDDGGVAASATKPSRGTSSAVVKKQATPQKPPAGTRKVLSPAQGKAFEALKTGSSA